MLFFRNIFDAFNLSIPKRKRAGGSLNSAGLHSEFQASQGCAVRACSKDKRVRRSGYGQSYYGNICGLNTHLP